MDKKNFSYRFKTAKTPHEVFELLLDVKKWWSGLYEETITGKSSRLNDEFTFSAGNGAHYTEQKLVELIPDKSIAWTITKSNLSFLEDPTEWEGTKIRFELTSDGKNTGVTFTHEGLIPQIECYDSCSGAWTGYFEKLESVLR